MIRQIRKYFRGIPARWRRIYASWHHRFVHLPRERRRLAAYTTGITQVVEGQPAIPTGIFCGFILFAPNGNLPQNVKHAVDAMRSAGINVIACLNAPISEESAKWLQSRVYQIVHRNNVGFDFGAYKDCVRLVTADQPDLQRFLFLNDSVFFIEDGLEQFFRDMIADYDSVAAFENWGDNTACHLQSFAVSVSGKVFFSQPFQQFWKQYTPISSRLHAIHEGEMKLSEAILKTAETSNVLYTCAGLAAQLENLDEEIICGDLIVPLQYRRLLSADEESKICLSAQYRSLLDIVNLSSPIHCGAWLFPRIMGTPIVKKDIVYRQRFQFWEVQRLFTDLMTEAELIEFSTLLRAKGNYQKLKAIDLARYELGIL